MKQQAWIEHLADSRTSVATHPHHYGYQEINKGYDTGGFRTIQDHTMFLILDGGGHVATPRKTVDFKSGSFVWIRAEARHHLVINPDTRRYTVRFRTEPHGKPLPNTVIHHPDAHRLRLYFEDLADELRLRLDFRNVMIRDLLVRLCVFGLRHKSSGIDRSGGLTEAQSRAILKIATENPGARPTPSDLAAAVRLSSDYFARKFKKTFGMSPRTWLVRERIRSAARDLLESGNNITETADHFGYEDVFQFSHQFKKVLGISPRDYILQQLRNPGTSL